MSVAENDILHNNENIDRIKNDIAQFDVNADELVKRIADKEKEISELDADIIAKRKSTVSFRNSLTKLIRLRVKAVMFCRKLLPNFLFLLQSRLMQELPR